MLIKKERKAEKMFIMHDSFSVILETLNQPVTTRGYVMTLFSFAFFFYRSADLRLEMRLSLHNTQMTMRMKATLQMMNNRDRGKVLMVARMHQPTIG
jgi:hypothetical protein